MGAQIELTVTGYGRHRRRRRPVWGRSEAGGATGSRAGPERADDGVLQVDADIAESGLGDKLRFELARDDGIDHCFALPLPSSS